MENVQRRLECGICLDNYIEPKELECKHIYCGTCIDNIVKFNIDGSASVTCPLKCEVITKLTDNQTSNSLDRNLYVEDILETLRRADGSEQQQRATKCNEVKCDGRMHAYCKTCNVIICKRCQGAHAQNHEQDVFVHVTFDLKNETTAALCDEHGIVATALCTEACCDKKFLCTYCVHRSHKGHQREDMQTKCDAIKDWLKSEEDRLATVGRSIQHEREQSVESISADRERFESLLKNRMLDVLCKLTQEKITLLEKYDRVAKEWRDACAVNPYKTLQEIHDKCDIEILCMETNIKEHITKLEAETQADPHSFKIGLTDVGKRNILGDLKKNPAQAANKHECANENPAVSYDDKIKRVHDFIDEEFPSSSRSIVRNSFICLSVFVAVSVFIAIVVRYDFPYSSVNGGYSEWSTFSTCSVTCDVGIQERKRFCNNPTPKHDGLDCSNLGEAVETRGCNMPACPINGGYGSWGSFSTCSRSCGGGIQERERVCNSPTPKFNGLNCSNLGEGIQTRRCNTDPCVQTLTMLNPSQSSTFKNSTADKALDGKLQGFGLNGGCSLTDDYLDKQIWQAEFSNQYVIVHVKILPPAGCCSDRYSNLQVYTSLGRGNTSWNLCFDLGNSMENLMTWVLVICPTGTVAKFIKIVLEDKKRLPLCEVEVSGHEPISRKLDLRNPWQSSTVEYNEASRALDQQLTGVGKDGGCSETAGLRDRQEWGAELEEPYIIVSFKVLPRTDCCQERYSNVNVYTRLDIDDPWDLCASFGRTLQNTKTWVEIACPEATAAKYIKVVSESRNNFALCEVESWGYAYSIKEIRAKDKLTHDKQKISLAFVLVVVFVFYFF